MLLVQGLAAFLRWTKAAPGKQTLDLLGKMTLSQWTCYLRNLIPETSANSGI